MIAQLFEIIFHVFEFYSVIVVLGLVSHGLAVVVVIVVVVLFECLFVSFFLSFFLCRCFCVV